MSPCKDIIIFFPHLTCALFTFVQTFSLVKLLALSKCRKVRTYLVVYFISVNSRLENTDFFVLL